MFTSETKVVRKKVLIYGLIGGLITAISGLLIVGFPLLVNTGLDSQLVIKEGNGVTNSWKEVPLPITSRVYIWNIENPVEFRRGAKPRVKEMGPYVYRKNTRKEIISWGPNKETVKYWLISSWKYDPDRSVGNHRDKVTIVNVPAYAMSAVIRGLVNKLPLSFAINPVVFGILNVLFSSHKEGFLKQLTVQELIDGYTFSILKTIDRVAKPLSWFGITLPDSGMPQNKFGVLHVKNFTKTGPYEIYTGQNDPKQFAKFKSYQGKRSLQIYDDRKCNSINGTEGIVFGRFLNKKDPVYLFNGDACRSLHVTYKELSNVRGIPTWRYVLPESLFAGPNKNPSNKCFCTTRKDYEKCDGIFDLGPCQKGAPLAFSFPHLWHASNKIQSGVYGMSPDPEKHESFFDVNPILGTPVRAAGRLQVNLLIKPNPYLTGFGKVRETVLPFVWVEEEGGVEGKFETMMRAATYALIFFEYGPILALISGLGFLGYTSRYSYKNRKILFGGNSQSNQLHPYSDMKSLVDPKAVLYPNLFTVSDKLQVNSVLYNNIRQQNYSNDKQTATKPQPVPNLPNVNKQRTIWSPPGFIE